MNKEEALRLLNEAKELQQTIRDSLEVVKEKRAKIQLDLDIKYAIHAPLEELTTLIEQIAEEDRIVIIGEIGIQLADDTISNMENYINTQY